MFFLPKHTPRHLAKRISRLASQQLKTDFNCAEFHLMNRIAHAAKMAPFILPHFWEERIDLMYIADLFFFFLIQVHEMKNYVQHWISFRLVGNRQVAQKVEFSIQMIVRIGRYKEYHSMVIAFFSFIFTWPKYTYVSIYWCSIALINRPIEFIGPESLIIRRNESKWLLGGGAESTKSTSIDSTRQESNFKRRLFIDQFDTH